MMNDHQGSVWRRWDPHIHTPGTVLNDQYSGNDPWNDFLDRIEQSNPPITALGITDYLNVDLYERVLQFKAAGRLFSVGLIFPNIEMRLGIGTAKGNPINLHLLVSPDTSDHVIQIRRFLVGLTFELRDETYRCDRADLIRLGKAHDQSATDDSRALAAGTMQFKVTLDELRSAWKASDWAQENILIGVAGSSTDGTAGIQDDASFTALRREIERFSHVIFASQPNQREFWLGRKSATVEQLAAIWDGPKPCIHGSDAHDHGSVGNPALDRFCWIKGDPTFESLRQACIEPEARCFVGNSPPRAALPSQVISCVEVTGAPWLNSSVIPLNPGLVAIIGGRGSGKTALADIIAAGSFALSSHLNERSFIRRARPYLAGSSATLTWGSGNTTSGLLQQAEAEYFFESPHIQYLSQQFVDTLCSSEGLTDELLLEIERVVYQAHDVLDRMGTTSFRELLELRTARRRSIRERHEEGVAQAANALFAERERVTRLPTVQSQRKDKADSIDKDKRYRSTLVAKGTEERTTRFDEVSAAAEALRFEIEQLRRRRQAILNLKDEVADTRQNKSPADLRELRRAYLETAISAEDWKKFLLDFVGDVDDVLDRAIRQIDNRIRQLSGPPVAEDAVSANVQPSVKSFLPPGADLARQTLNLLNKEIALLRGLIGIDAENVRTFTRLSEKISRDEAALAQLDRQIAAANSAPDRIKELLKTRRDHYAAIFEGIIEEETELASLYEPLKARLGDEKGALGKLSFDVRRVADIESWARQGEELLDLRKAATFKGRGALLEAAKRDILPAWETGSATNAADALASFVETHSRSFLDHSPVDKADANAMADWTSKVAKWLFSTNHIKVEYGVQYEGVAIEQLSPGTRGIVLLLLYLAIDREDDRPLIIDQPEENLDPKSIFDELVERFRKTKLRRQIVIVTHNANLVVNTDADQVVIAKCGSHRPGALPEITYESGGLENPNIRRQVCEILEGGETAFKERARRLRVRMGQ